MTKLSAAPAGKRELSIGDRAWAYVELVRPANVVTAAADVLAGYAAAGLPAPRVLAWLVPSAMALYAGGVAFNDFCDRRLDAMERPERPIPSGRASPRGAAVVAVVLGTLGVVFAFQASATSGLVAVAIAGAVIVYDTWGKHRSIVGPLNIGLCRALDLMLGVSAVPAMLAQRWTLMLIPLAYVAAVGALGAGEVHGGRRWIAGTAMVLILSAMLALPVAGETSWSLPFLALLGWRLLPALWRAVTLPDPMRLRAAVKAGVLSLIVLDAAIAAGYAGWLFGIGVLVLLPLAGRLARIFAVT